MRLQVRARPHRQVSIPPLRRDSRLVPFQLYAPNSVGMAYGNGSRQRATIQLA